jgi:dethiobiotin synthetase/adenosylmethionine--8-amino-7-oxononanoate aminotransferase
VFSGLYRFGYNSASTVLSQTPDIAAYAKILTGGLLPLSTTLASTSIFDAFLSDRKVDALLHGHSYTANPVGCAVALKAAEMIERHEQQGGWDTEKAMWGVRGTRGDEDRVGVVRGEEEGRWSFWNREFVKDVSTIRGVKGSMAMGTVLAVELEDAEGGEFSGTWPRTATQRRPVVLHTAFAPIRSAASLCQTDTQWEQLLTTGKGYSSHTALNFLTKLRQEPIGPVSQSDQFQPFQIHSRPLGNVVYVITSLWTKPEVMRAMEGAITKHLHAIQG